MLNLLKILFPINRSITGEGVLKTLEIIRDEIGQLKIKNIPSGAKVFDWIVPDEWNINNAWIKASDGEKIIDFKKSNLHIMNYSVPVNKELSWEELKPHLNTHNELDNAIPYLTTYYKKDWGFCLTKKQYNKLEKQKEGKKRMKQIEKAVVGESARWGDLGGRRGGFLGLFGIGNSGPKTRDEHWRGEANRVLNDYLPLRSGVLLSQLWRQGLMPDITPPRHRKLPGGKLELSAPRGRIYYRLDGKDPRDTGDEVNPAARPYEAPIDTGKGSPIKSRVRYKGEWSMVRFLLIQTGIGNTLKDRCLIFQIV